MNSNHAVRFLNRSKNKMVFRSMFPAASPFHFVIAKSAAKISLVHLIENFAKIEVLTFLTKIELALHRQRAIRDFAFCFLRHNWNPGWKGCNSKWVRTGRQEKRLIFRIFQTRL